MSGSLAGELAAFGAQRLAASGAGRVGRGARGKKVYGITDAGGNGSASCWPIPTCPTTRCSPCGSPSPQPRSRRASTCSSGAAELSQRAAQPAGPGERRRQHLPALPAGARPKRRWPPTSPGSTGSSPTSATRSTPTTTPPSDPALQEAILMSTIRLAIAGVGNCASSLVQGIEYYWTLRSRESVPGPAHVELGGYHVGTSRSWPPSTSTRPRWASTGQGHPRRAQQHHPFCEVPDLDVVVQRGPTLDGFGEFYTQECVESPAEPVDVAEALRKARRRAGVVPGRRVGGPEALRPGLPRRGRRLRQRHPGVHRLGPRGPRASAEAGVPIVATTSSPRSGPPSCTAPWPGCSRTAAPRSTTPTS